MRRREKLFWLCAGAALVVLVLSLVPSHYPICDVAEQTKEEHCAAYRVLPFLVIKIGKILDDHNGAVTAVFTIVLAISTIGLWLATNNLWRAGEKQFELLSESAAAQSRDMQQSIATAKSAAQTAKDALTKLECAFISFSLKAEGMWSPATNEVLGYRVAVSMKNSGRTQTKGLYTHVNQDCFPDGLPPNFTYPDIWAVGVSPVNILAFVGPGDTINSEYIYVGVSFFEAARNGHLKIYLWGWAEYDDIFEGTKPHRTEFCSEIIVHSDPYIRGQELPFGFRFAPPHVGADEECYRQARPREQRSEPIT